MSRTARPTTGYSPSHIDKYLRRLRRDSPTRLAAERLLETGAVDPESVEFLALAADSMKDIRWRERAVAAWCLGECDLAPDQRDAVTTALRTLLDGIDVFNISGWLRRSAVMCASTSFSLVGLVLAAGFFAPTMGSTNVVATAVSWWVSGTLLGGTFLAFVLFAPYLMVAGALDDAPLHHAMAEAATALGKLSDPMAAGNLARAQVDRNKALRKAAQDALPTVLNAIREEHYGLLPRDATPALCDALQLMDSRHVVPILEALGRAGDGRAVAPVRQFLTARSWRSGWSGSDEGKECDRLVLATAQRVLPILEDRLRQETVAERLLRPAQAPGAPEDLLLRPAGSASAVPEAQLLRPTSVPLARGDDDA